MSSLLEIICGVGSRLPVCTRIVMRRACLCAVRWGNGLRCGTRAVIWRCFARICWLRWEATDLCPSLREIHVVTLFFAIIFCGRVFPRVETSSRDASRAI